MSGRAPSPPALPTSQSTKSPRPVQRAAQATDSESRVSFQQDPPIWKRLLNHLRGHEGAGYAFSFLIHVILLALLAIPVVREFRADETFTTLVENSTDEDVAFNAPIDTASPIPEPPKSADEFQSKLLDPLAFEKKLVPEIEVGQQTSVDNKSDGTGIGDESLGSRVAEPQNAIKAGNFSVWYWPIIGTDLETGNFKHGIPGEAPKVKQAYSIVIRIKVPDSKSFVRLDEFTGTVIGTDGYTQKIPEDAYYYRVGGDLVKARSSHRIPIIDGTAEILIRVPGARQAQVRDTIDVHSRTLDEDQTVQLVFQARE